MLALLLALIPVLAGRSGLAQVPTTDRAATLAEAERLNAQAIRLYGEGKYAQATPLAEQALLLREGARGREHPEVAVALNDLAELYQVQGAYGKAEPLFLRALRIREKALGSEHPDVAQSLTNLAALYRVQGAYEKAEPLYLRALHIREKALGPKHPATAASVQNLATLYQAQGAYAKAEPLFERALSIHEKALGQGHPDAVTSLNELAEHYKAQGAYAKAESLYKRALNIRERVLGPEHPSVAQSLNNLAVLYDSQEKYEKAEPLQRRALAIQEKALGPENLDVAQSLNNLAALYQAQGAYAKAEPLYQRALAVFENELGPEHPAAATSLHNLSVLCQAQGQYQAALTYKARTTTILERYLGTELGSLPKPHKRQLLQRLRGEDEWTASFHVQDAPNDQTALVVALTTALRRKGRILEELAGAQATLRRSLSPSLQAELDVLSTKQAELAAVESEGRPEQKEARRALKQEVELRARELGRRSATFMAQIAPVTIAPVQAALPKDAALVEFVRYHRFDPNDVTRPWKEARYVAYVLRPEGPPSWVSLGEARPIEQAIQAVRADVTERTLDARGRPLAPARDARPALRRLDALMLAPIRNLVGEVPHLLLAPDGALHTVPFEALVDEQGRYLVERSLVTYLGSGRDLLRLRGRLPPRSGPLVLAAPDYGPGSEPFTPLRGATAEAQAVQALFPEAHVLIGSGASRQALLEAKAPRFVLAATHGFLRHPGMTTTPAPHSSRLPSSILPLSRRGTVLRFAASPSDEYDEPGQALEHAGLAFAGANSNPNAVINGLDLAGLDLEGTKLVVLSACETGLGQLVDGEGVYGLRRAVSIAGAESEVVSLWSVDDMATGTLMGAYFGALRRGMGRSEALRQAQVGLLKQERYRHPYYWAAFIPAGDWRPLDGGAAPPPPVKGACGCRMAGVDNTSEKAGAVVAVLAFVAGARRRARPTGRSRRDRREEGGVDGEVG